MEIWVKCLTLALATALSYQRTIRHEGQLKSDGISSQSNYGDTSSLVIREDLANCSCDTRYVLHYEAKGCKPSQRNACGCPIKFECPNPNEIEEDNKVCRYKGKPYLPGMRVDTGNPCQDCQCSVGSYIGIICTLVKCPATTNVSGENCHEVYEVDQCCSIKTVCLDEEGANRERSNTTCEYNGRLFPLGARMYSSEDPCEVCLCTADWISSNGTNTSCYQTNCILEKFKTRLLKGCVPVYQDKICCPIDFYCAPDDEFLHENKTVESEIAEENSDLQCAFFGKSYKIGESVSITGNPDCLSCVCQVPPDITCIQQTCAANPWKENCYPYYTPGGGCCPKYDCLQNDGESTSGHSTDSGLEELDRREMEDEGPVNYTGNVETGCSDTHCSEDMTCMLYQVSCGNRTCLPVATCMKINSSCPTPQCDTGCVVTEQDSNHCPTCVCGEDIEKRDTSLKCQMPQCVGQSCILVAGYDGCPMCSCVGTCPVLECKPGCNVLREIEGRCPKCVCEDETEGCPTPVCEHEGCIIENLPNGCPTCICGSANTGRELEENEDRVVNPGQQQQQQQTDVNTESEVMHPPETSEMSDEYDDSIVFMSGVISGQSSNMQKRSPFLDQSHNDASNPKSKILTKSTQPTSNNIETVGVESEQLKSIESASKYMQEQLPGRARPDP